jgi:hypothetical protein
VTLKQREGCGEMFCFWLKGERDWKENRSEWMHSWRFGAMGLSSRRTHSSIRKTRKIWTHLQYLHLTKNWNQHNHLKFQRLLKSSKKNIWFSFRKKGKGGIVFQNSKPILIGFFLMTCPHFQILKGSINKDVTQQFCP